ncbi:PilW family protein [Dyella sp. RRB7]|uniref:PilW family protein n=1 Tax=Dyella sp. RRB7 TaxID=2919502 RepID=UPI001FAAC099|nr:PilW family protein [Dyella sp. RRB7]
MRTHTHHQRGVGLITLLVALTIGLFLLAGLFQIWLQTRQTFGAQGQLAKLQDDERMVLTTMANTIQTGGYYPVYLNYSATPPATPYTSSSFTNTGVFAAASGQFLYGTHSTTPPGDTLYVRFIADSTSTNSNNTTLDCQGQTETTGTIVTNIYQVRSGQLQCSTDNGTTWQPIIGDGIYNMEIVYCVDTLGDQTQMEYLTADNMTTSDWTKVVSVNVQLTFNNPLYGQPGQQAQLNPQLLPINRIVAINQTQQ